MIERDSKPHWRRSVAFMAALLVTPACGLPVEGADEPELLDEVESPIINGDPVTSPDIHVALAVTASGVVFCSGTLLDSRWVLTAKHCDTTPTTPDFATQLVLGAEKRSVARSFKHPNLDVMLLEASSPFPNVLPLSMYPWGGEYLVGQNVTCYGYGHNTDAHTGIGTLRQGAMRIAYAGGNEFTVKPADERNQLTTKGDSGGGCFLNNNKARAVLGVSSYNTPGLRQATYVATSAFSQWALPIIADSSKRLICQGRECVTNPRPLPDRLSQEVAWQPCPGQLSEPGGYSFDFEINYDMEYYYDNILFDGQFLTGRATKRGTSSASHLGHRLGVYTDRNIQSEGIRWLRARCPNDP